MSAGLRLNNRLFGSEPRGRRSPVCKAAASLLALATACAPAPEAPTNQQLLASAAETVFDPGSISPTQVLQTVELPGRTTPEPPDANPPLAIVPLVGVAEKLRTVEVEVGDMSRGQLRLDWTTPSTGEPCGLIGQAEHAQVLPDSFRLFRFDLADAPCWEPTTERLVLATGQKHRARVIPRVMRLLTRQVDPERIEGRSFGVSIGDELRNTTLVSSGHPWRTTIKVFRGAELRFGLGIKGPSSEVRFTLSARRLPEGPAVDLETYSCPEHECRERWVDHAVALDQLEPGDWEISVSNDLDTGSRATAFLATPEIVAPTARATAERPNIVLVVIDTLRADHLGTYGYPLPTSPNIDRWARERGVVFEQAIAAAPTTLPSHASMFTGLDALRHGANHEPVSPELTLVAERLRAAGYSTAAATGGGFLHPRYNLFQGFDRYRYFLAGHLRENELASNLPAVLEWIDTLPQPYFVLLHTYEVHGPYRPRQPYLDQLHPGRTNAELVWLDAEPPASEAGFRVRRRGNYFPQVDGKTVGDSVGSDAAIAHYDSSIAYVDAAFGRVLAALEAHPETAVVVTSDHGEAFGEHEHAGHGYLFENNIHVPLILSAPASWSQEIPPARRTPQVRGIDLAPTLLDLAGVGAEPGTNGASLLPLARNADAPHPDQALTWAANTNYGLSLRQRGRAKLTFSDAVWPPFHGATSLFRLDRDPAEDRDLADAEPDAVARGMAEFRAAWAEAAGTHIYLSSKAPARLKLRGGSLTGTKAKSLDSCSCFELGANGELVVTLTAGQSIELLLEGPATPGLTISTVAGRVALAVDIPLPAAPALEFACEVDCGLEGGGAVQGKVWSVGPAGPAQPAAPDSELVQQLRALGYLQ
jgi:arylsulfatase A-like enzyme